MLTELSISNFAIIEHQSISFGKGLNVISGETGAGKSIVLHALELILGGRAKPKYIRSGSDGFEIQAHFDLRSVDEITLQDLPDIARGEELVVSRSLAANGRGKVHINGKLGTVALLEEISTRLINICSQGHQIRLLRPEYHLQLVDEFAGHEKLLSRYAKSYTNWKALSETLRKLTENADRNSLRRAELEFILEELGAAKLSGDLRTSLDEQIGRLANAEQIIGTGSQIIDVLNGDSGAFESLAKVRTLLTPLARSDKTLQESEALFESAWTELQEFQSDLEDYVSKTSVDESALEDLRTRLAEVARLERKYRVDCKGLVQIEAQAQSELLEIAAGDNLDELTEKVAEAEGKLLKAAKALNDSRQKAAQKLTRAVEHDLSELNMAGAELCVKTEARGFGPDGNQSLELLISANKGEPARALREVASGGELSRIMLVLKKVLRDKSGVNVLIFDEVDTGISGAVARSVGRMLSELADDSQVLCITHLAQVASLADRHYLVDKQSDERTFSVIREICEEEKIEEIARMLAGYEVTAAARESARELLSSK